MTFHPQLITKKERKKGIGIEREREQAQPGDRKEKSMYSWTETWMKRIKEYPQRPGLGIIAIVSNMNA